MQIIEKIFPELVGQTWQIVLIAFSIVVLLYLLNAIAAWKVFKKMGEKGWKAFVPFYNLYLLIKRCSKNKYFIAIMIWNILYVVEDAQVLILDENSIWYLGACILQIVSLIALIVYEVRIKVDVSRSFGHGGAFAVGLFFLPFIFELILGFGSSKYTGNATEKKSKLLN